MWSTGFLQSRTYEAANGTPAAGRWMYQYRVDLTRVATAAAPPRVISFTIDFGPAAALDFNGDGSTEQVFVITQGGLGSVAPVTAEQTGRMITFTFTPPVAGGQTTYFFGLVSDAGPVPVQATLATNLQGAVSLEARAPRDPQGGMQRPQRPGGRPLVPPGQVNRPLRPIAAEDCLSYDSQRLRIVNEGANGWLLTDGGSRMLTLDNQADAERALALAQRHTRTASSDATTRARTGRATSRTTGRAAPASPPPSPARTASRTTRPPWASSTVPCWGGGWKTAAASWCCSTTTRTPTAA